MKMKKLLAGVLSAAMVATMIPASMALGVSAAPEDSLVASYNFTTDEGRNGWTGYTVGGLGATYTEGDSAITMDENGVTLPAGTHNYSISNPLAGEVTDGFTVVADISIPAGQAQTEYEGLFGFGNHTTWAFMGVTNDGYTARANCEPSSGHHWYDMVHTGTDVDFSTPVRYVMTANADEMVLYVDGEEIVTYANGTADATSYVGSTTLDFANEALYFNFGQFMGSGSWEWWGSAMTVSAVSFYNSALSADDVAALGAYQPPVVEPDAITASVVDTTAQESYEAGDTVTVEVQATGNVDLGGYTFTLAYDKDLLEVSLPEDSSDPSVVVTNDAEKGVVVLKVDLNGENSVVLSDEAATLASLSFTVKDFAESTETQLSLSDTMFAYYDNSGIPTAYDLVPTLNSCTIALTVPVSAGNQYDFNLDGQADPTVLDVMALAQLIVDEAPMDNPDLAYNVNESDDDVVDLLDVMALAQIVVNS